jgi:STE24 endopeptidase
LTSDQREIELTPPQAIGIDQRGDSSAGLSAEQLAEAKAYGKKHLIAGLVDMGIDLLYLGLIAFFVADPLDDFLKKYVPGDTPRLVVLLAMVMAAHECVSFPLAWYSGHMLEQRYGLSRQTFAAWLYRHLKQFGLATVLALLLFVGLFWIIRLAGPWWWVVAAGAFFVVSVLLSQLVPVLILPLFYKIEPLENPLLAERMARLAQDTGLAIEGIYRMQLSDETVKANAMLAGLGRTRRVLLGDTLLDNFTPEEIEVIFAHELGHHVYRHIPKTIVIGLVLVTIGFQVCDQVLRHALIDSGGPAGYHHLPVHVMPLLMFALTVFFLLLGPLQNVVSRHFEHQCDRYALARTGMKGAYVSAFRKLARLNKDDPDPHPLEVVLFHSHPPISQRLATVAN